MQRTEYVSKEVRSPDPEQQLVAEANANWRSSSHASHRRWRMARHGLTADYSDQCERRSQPANHGRPRGLRRSFSVRKQPRSLSSKLQQPPTSDDRVDSSELCRRRRRRTDPRNWRITRSIFSPLTFRSLAERSFHFGVFRSNERLRTIIEPSFPSGGAIRRS